MRADMKHLVCLICLLILAAGCTRKVYVPVENVTLRADTVYSAKVRVDSVVMRDSVAVFQKGDTVYYTKYRDHYKIRERVDTLYQTATDSVTIREPYPVEKELTAWQKFRVGAFWYLLIISLISIVLLTRKLKARV